MAENQLAEVIVENGITCHLAVKRTMKKEGITERLKNENSLNGYKE